MTFLTRIEKLYNRLYFITEFFSVLFEEVEFYIKYVIAKLIDSCSPKAHMRIKEARARSRSNIDQEWKVAFSSFNSMRVTFSRGVVSCVSFLPIFLFSQFILKMFSKYFENEQIEWNGGNYTLFMSFIICFLIDYFFSLRHNKYEKYREEYLRDNTSQKARKTICVVLFVNLLLFGSIMLHALYSDKIAEYIVSLIK